jgi:hypothetical protein
MQKPAGKVFVAGGIIASFIVIGIGYFYFDRRGDPAAQDATLPFQSASDDTIQISDVTGDDPTIVDVVKKVSQHIVLPDGSVTVTTITDADNLRATDPVFYRYAQIGDKLLLYDDRAILYSPSIDRVLDISHTITKEDL